MQNRKTLNTQNEKLPNANKTQLKVKLLEKFVNALLESIKT